MDPSRSHRLVYVINNFEGPRTMQYNTISNIFFLCFDLPFIKFLIITREKQELSGFESGTSSLLAFVDIFIYTYFLLKHNKFILI